MIEVVLNDRLGRKIRVKCNPSDTIGDLKKLVAAQTGEFCITLFYLGTRPEKIRIQKWYHTYKDHITLADYEINDGMGLELYYNSRVCFNKEINTKDIPSCTLAYNVRLTFFQIQALRSRSPSSRMWDTLRMHLKYQYDCQSRQNDKTRSCSQCDESP